MNKWKKGQNDETKLLTFAVLSQWFLYQWLVIRFDRRLKSNGKIERPGIGKAEQ